MAGYLPTCISGCPGISPLKCVASPLQKTEHAMGTLGCAGAERQPMLLGAEREESAVTKGG